MNKELFQFLSELRLHNNREWFQANKPRYDLLHRQFLEVVQELINRMTLFEPELAGLTPKDCIFRIYRDIRFSSDKTPYKTHFGAYIAAYGGRKSEYAGYYLHLEPGASMLAGGVWCPPPALLKLFRKDIYENMDEMVEILEQPDFKRVYPEMMGEVLKRMPEGYPSDCPHGELLRRKDFSVVSHKPDDFFLSPDWLDHVVEDFKLLYPFNRFLNYTVNEFYGK